MPYVGSDWTDADPEADQPYGLDFRNDLADEESIQFAQISIEVVEGADAAAASRIHGPTINGTVIRLWARTLQPAVKYRIVMRATTNLGVRTLWSHVTCVQRLLA